MTYAMTAFSPIGPYYDADRGGVHRGHLLGWSHPRRAAPGDAALHRPQRDGQHLVERGLPPAAGGYSALVVQKVQSRPYTPLFKQVYGPDVFTKYTTPQIYTVITDAIAAYEASAEINPFNSKYDASKYGVPPQKLYTLSASEERGRILYGVGPNPSNNP